MKVEISEILATLHVVRLPMVTEFRGLRAREVALFQGPSGWGEFSPFLEYDALESSRWLAAGIESAFSPPLESLRESVEVNATLPAVTDRAEIPTLLARYSGVRCAKLKMTKDAESNAARIAMVREIDPRISIRLDVNGAWSVDEAISFLGNLVGEIEYVEQPCATLEELRELKREIEIKVAVDEIVRKSADPFQLDLQGAADIVILKSAPLGGNLRARRIAEHFDLPVVVTSALDSAVGISSGLELAASLDSHLASGLATGALFTEDVGEHRIEAGAIKVKRVSPSSLEKLAVEPERFRWWENRLRECHEVLFA